MFDSLYNIAQFFELFGECNKNPVKHGKWAKSIHFTDSPWPNFFYELNSQGLPPAELLEELKKQYKMGSLSRYYLTRVEEHESTWVKYLLNQNLMDRSWRSMTLDLKKIIQPPIPDGLEILEAKTDQELELHCQVNQGSLLSNRAFDFQIFKNLASAGAMRYFLGMYRGEAASISMLFKQDEWAGIYFVGTLPSYERLGLGTALTHYAVQVGKEMGCKQAVLQATSAGAPVYARLGFEDRGCMSIFDFDEFENASK